MTTTNTPDPQAVQDLFSAVRSWMVRTQLEEANHAELVGAVAGIRLDDAILLTDDVHVVDRSYSTGG